MKRNPRIIFIQSVWKRLKREQKEGIAPTMPLDSQDD